MTYPLTLPSTPGYSAFTLSRTDTVGVSKSPYTAAQEVIGYPGQWWSADVTVAPMKIADANIWSAFFAKLKGAYGTFLMGHPLRATPQGPMSGTPLVNGALSVGDTQIVLDGATDSITGWAKAGDHIQTGSGSTANLYMITDDADSDGSGNVTLNIWPSIQAVVADNAALVVSNCVGVFRLTSSTVQEPVQPGGIYSVSFSAMQAL